MIRRRNVSIKHFLKLTFKDKMTQLKGIRIHTVFISTYNDQSEY